MSGAEHEAFVAAFNALEAWCEKAKAALNEADPDEVMRIWWDANNLIGYAGLVRTLADDLRRGSVSSRN